MSSRLSIILASGFWLLLSACGFHPMYGEESVGGKDSPLRGNIALDNVGSGHEGQMLKIALEDRFNPESLSTMNARYHLAIGMNKSVGPAVIRSDGTIQRYQVTFSSDFKLFKTGNAVPIFSGTLSRNGSYNAAVNANFATYEAEQDVIGRVLDEMAEDYVMRISAYLEARPDKPEPPARIVPPVKPVS